MGTGVLGKVVGFLATSLITLILTVFMLSEARMFGRRMEAISLARGPNLTRMLSGDKGHPAFSRNQDCGQRSYRYFGGHLVLGRRSRISSSSGASLRSFFNFIPVVGSIIAGVPPTILALFVAGLPNAVLVAGGYLIINNFLGNFVEPMLVGRRFGISTLVIVVSVVFWGWLWGPLGMLLAVPLTMVLKVILESSDEFRWIGVAISAEQPAGSAEKKLLEVTPPSKAPPPVEPAEVKGT